jgi:hypothetical protein
VNRAVKGPRRKALARRYGRSRTTNAGPCTGACCEIDEDTRRDAFNAIAEHHALIFGVPFTPLPMMRARRSGNGGSCG